MVWHHPYPHLHSLYIPNPECQRIYRPSSLKILFLDFWGGQVGGGSDTNKLCL